MVPSTVMRLPPVTAEAVRDLVGLAQETAVERFIDALSSGDALDGMRVLDDLEAEGRDLVGFSEQAVTALRRRLVAGRLLHAGGLCGEAGRDPSGGRTGRPRPA